jgi:hypothetical protein
VAQPGHDNVEIFFVYQRFVNRTDVNVITKLLHYGNFVIGMFLAVPCLERMVNVASHQFLHHHDMLGGLKGLL